MPNQSKQKPAAALDTLFFRDMLRTLLLASETALFVDYRLFYEGVVMRILKSAILICHNIRQCYIFQKRRNEVKNELPFYRSAGFHRLIS